MNGDAEPYLPEAGLAVWEVAWLAREYDGNSAAVASHALVDIDVIEEGLSYAAAHAQEIEAQIISHTEVPLEKLRELLPGLRVITIDPDDPGGRSE